MVLFNNLSAGGNVTLTDALRMTSLSDTGLVRELNEDSVALRPKQGIVVLADGMGGYNAGEVASDMAVTLVADGLAQVWNADALRGLDRAGAIALSHTALQAQAKSANLAIYNAAQDDEQFRGMGTTLVACLFYDNFITVGHMGDSRLYRLRDEQLEQLTHDHSLLQEQIDAGMLRKEDAHLSNNRNCITRAVGVDPADEAEIHTYEVAEGDIYLLCSDGLYGMVSDHDIQTTLVALKANLNVAAEQLVQAANDAGGTDNVSVILVRAIKSFEAGAD